MPGTVSFLVHCGAQEGFSQQEEWEAITIMLIGYQLTACCAETLVSYTDSTSVLFIGQVLWEKGITDCSCLSNMVALVLQEATF